jgi:hypothetical protein
MSQKIRISIRNGKLKINGKTPPRVVRRSHACQEAMMMCVGLQRLSSSAQFNKAIADLHKCAGLEEGFREELQTAVWEAVRHGKSIREVVAKLRLIKHNWKTALDSKRFVRSIRRLRVNQSVILRNGEGRKIKVTRLYGQLKVDFLTETLSIILRRGSAPRIHPRDLFSCRSIIRYHYPLLDVRVNNQGIEEQEAFERLLAFEKPGGDDIRQYEHVFKDYLFLIRIMHLKNGEKLVRTLQNGLAVTIQRRNGRFYAETNIGIAFVIKRRRTPLEDDTLEGFAKFIQGCNPLFPVFYSDRIKHFLGQSYDLVIFGKTWPQNKENLALVHTCLLKNQSPSMRSLLDAPSRSNQAAPASC